MPDPRRQRGTAPRRARILPSLLVAAAGALPGAAPADSAPAAGAGWPPAVFRLDELRLDVRREPAHGLPPQRVALGGDGTGSLERGGARRAFRIDREGVAGLVDALYRLRFFDLPAQLLPTRSVFLREDGSVGTQALRLHDAVTTTVCFVLPAYRKCVAYQADPPAELEAFVQRLLSAAEGQAGGASAPGRTTP